MGKIGSQPSYEFGAGSSCAGDFDGEQLGLQNEFDGYCHSW